jgi:hypothetical protein
MKTLFVTISMVFSFCSCSSPDYRYQPLEHQVSQQGKGKSEALYSEPANAPEGKVRIVSAGIADIKSKQDPKPFPALHLQVSVTNQSTTEPWTFHSQDQFVSFPNDGQSKPLKMDPSSNESWMVGPGELKTFDYYFPLPNEGMSAESVPEFDFHWQLQAGQNLVRETTSFDRIQIHELYASAYYGPYDGPWIYPGPYWGWGPEWRGGGFVVVRPR